jgi:hypothetical protein
MQRLDDEAEAILDSIRNETVGSPSDHDGDTNGGGGANYHSIHDSSDYDDDEIDDEINDEILKLGTRDGQFASRLG